MMKVLLQRKKVETSVTNKISVVISIEIAVEFKAVKSADTATEMLRKLKLFSTDTINALHQSLQIPLQITMQKFLQT